MEVMDQPIYRRDYRRAGDQPVSQFGSSGEGDGQFVSPTSVACNSRGEIVVIDCDNHRIQCLIEMASSCFGLGQREMEMAC